MLLVLSFTKGSQFRNRDASHLCKCPVPLLLDLCVQVSHHPPVCAAHAENAHFAYDLVSAPTTKFLGNSLEVYPYGGSWVGSCWVCMGELVAGRCAGALQMIESASRTSTRRWCTARPGCNMFPVPFAHSMPACCPKIEGSTASQLPTPWHCMLSWCTRVADMFTACLLSTCRAHPHHPAQLRGGLHSGAPECDGPQHCDWAHLD
jgi:hypothetical protein